MLENVSKSVNNFFPIERLGTDAWVGGPEVALPFGRKLIERHRLGFVHLDEITFKFASYRSKIHDG